MSPYTCTRSRRREGRTTSSMRTSSRLTKAPVWSTPQRSTASTTFGCARKRAFRSGTRWASTASFCPMLKSSPAFTSRRPTRSSRTTSSPAGSSTRPRPSCIRTPSAGAAARLSSTTRSTRGTCGRQSERQRCVSSAAEIGLDDSADLHRPYIDNVTIPCPKCGGVMHRIPEVLDTWFDSGSMPFAQRGHPRHGTKEFEGTFPADFISEGLDQTRGWFYSLLAISTLLFKQNAYRNVICLGLVVDPKGKKASKSRGNVLDPNFLFDNFGSDAVRWYFYTSTPVGENYRTSAETLRETVQQFFIPLWNCYSFHVNYARLDDFDPS